MPRMQEQLTLSAVEGPAVLPGQLRASLTVPASHPILVGHFPGAPLVPGVLLLQAVQQAFEEVTSRSFTITAIDEVRWHAPLAPEVVATMQATVTALDTGVAIAGEWHSAAGRVAAFSLRLSPRS